MSIYLTAIVDLLLINFFISLPIIVIAAIGQWVIQFRFISNHNVAHMQGLLCILYTQISTFFMALLIWILWPLDPELIMYHNRISIPAVIAEVIAMPFWIIRFDYFALKKKSKQSF